MGRGAQAILTAISLLLLLEMKGLSRINNYVEVLSAAFDRDPPPTAVPINGTLVVMDQEVYGRLTLRIRRIKQAGTPCDCIHAQLKAEGPTTMAK